MHNKQLYLTLVILLGGSVLGGLLYAFSPEVERNDRAFNTPVVKVAIASAKSLSIPVFTRGTVQPRTEINLVAEVSGQVIEVSPSFVNGGFFDKGESLLKINPLEYELAIHQAQARVASAKQQLATAKARAQQAIHDLKKAGKKLSKASPYARHKPQLEEAHALLKSAQAQLAIARLNLDKTDIVAPFDGRVRSKSVDLGEYLGPGKVMADIYAIDFVEVRLPLTDRQLSLLDSSWLYRIDEPESDIESKPDVMLDASFIGKHYQWDAQIVRSEGAIDQQDRLLYLVAQVEKPYDRDSELAQKPPLAIGLFVEARIDGKRQENIFELPRSALRGGDTVWVVGTDDLLEMRKVKILYKNYDRVFVESGLDDGDRVITSSLEIVSSGMRIKVQKSNNVADEVDSSPVNNHISEKDISG